MENPRYDSLKLEHQLCFPLYACSREVIKRYRPYLEELDLTYTQYITMMVLWEMGQVNVKTLGKKLFLDSGTLTPVLKSLEAKGLITRSRAKMDERVLLVEPTPAGQQLRERALGVPREMSKTVMLDEAETLDLYHLLYKMLGVQQGSEE